MSTSLPSTTDIITQLFVHIDDRLGPQPKHPLARLHVSEVVTLGCLFALKGSSFKAFYRWLARDHRALFPTLPERSRLTRLIERYSFWCADFLADSSTFTVMDSDPIERIHPRRQGRSRTQLGKKSKDKGRWSVGIKRCWQLNNAGGVVNFGWSTMNAPDKLFNGLAQRLSGKSIVLTDLGFRAQEGVPENLKLCKKGTWNERMQVETALSMVTRVMNLKRLDHRRNSSLTAHLAYAVTVFNLLLDCSRPLFHWKGHDALHMSIAHFSL